MKKSFNFKCVVSNHPMALQSKYVIDSFSFGSSKDSKNGFAMNERVYHCLSDVSHSRRCNQIKFILKNETLISSKTLF